MSIKKRHHIRDSDIRKMVEKLSPALGKEIKNLLQGQVEKAEFETGKEIILVNGTPTLFKKEEKFIPLIFAADRLSLKRVTVDMGAVKPITDGADIMAPGIVDVNEDIEQGEIVAIEDEENRKTIAIGESLEKGDSLMGKEGKMIKNLHYVGDDFWSLKEEI